MDDELGYKAIRKHSAQNDLFHRLHSIAADEAFVRKVQEEWYEGRFEVVGKHHRVGRQRSLRRISKSEMWELVLCSLSKRISGVKLMFRRALLPTRTSNRQMGIPPYGRHSC